MSSKGSRRYSVLAVVVLAASVLFAGCVRMTPDYIRGSEYERAVLLYQAGLLVDASEAAGRVPAGSKDERSAKVLIRTIEVMADRFASGHVELGSELERAGIYPAALREYRAARSYKPDDERIGALVKKMEDAVAARSAPDMDAVLKTAPGAKAKKAAPRPRSSNESVKKLKASQEADEIAGVHHTRGLVYLEDGDYQAAIREFEAVLVIMPGYMDTIVRLGEARERMDNVVDTHLKRGISYFQKEDMVLAIKEWEAALALDPANQRAADYKARAELIIERLEKIRERQGAK